MYNDRENDILNSNSNEQITLLLPCNDYNFYQSSIKPVEKIQALGCCNVKLAVEHDTDVVGFSTDSQPFSLQSEEIPKREPLNKISFNMKTLPSSFFESFEDQTSFEIGVMKPGNPLYDSLLPSQKDHMEDLKPKDDPDDLITVSNSSPGLRKQSSRCLSLEILSQSSFNQPSLKCGTLKDSNNGSYNME